MPISRSRLEIFKRTPLDNDNKLNSWWPLDNSADDISGLNNMGAFVAAPPAVHGPARATGISLNGTTQYVTTTTNFGNGSGTDGLMLITAMAWFKTTTASGVSFIMVNQLQNGSDAVSDRGLYIGTDGKVYAYVFDTGAKNAVSTATYNDGLWHHAAVTINQNDTMKLYVDGALQQSTVITFPYTGYLSTFWVMGRNGAIAGANSAAGFFTGSIADAKHYKRVLDPSEISAEYNRTIAGFALQPDEWEIPMRPFIAPGVFPSILVQSTLRF